MSQKRVFGFWSLALYATSMNLGIRWLATAAAAGAASLPIWILAAVGFLVPLAIATAELTGRFPEEGGIYAWTREVFGPFAGFVCGWMYWMSNIPYFSGLFVFTANLIAQIAGPNYAYIFGQPWFALAFSIVGVVGVAVMTLYGMAANKWFSNLGSIATLVILGILFAIGAALIVTHGPATDFARANYAPPFNADGAILWSTMVFAFGGAEGIALLRNDVRGGMKTIVAALMLVAALLAFTYMIGTTVMLSIVPVGEATRLSGVGDAFNVALGKLGLFAWFPWVMLAFAFSQVGGVSSWFAATARLPYAAGLAHALPALFAKRDEKTGAPVPAIIAQAVFVIAFVILSQAGSNAKAAYDFLVSMSVLSYVLPYVFLFAVYIKVQGKPAPEGAWLTPGGAKAARWIGAGAFVVTWSAILCTLVPSPDEANKLAWVFKTVIASIVLIFAGAIVYWLNARKRAAPVPN